MPPWLLAWQTRTVASAEAASVEAATVDLVVAVQPLLHRCRGLRAAGVVVPAEGVRELVALVDVDLAVVAAPADHAVALMQSRSHRCQCRRRILSRHMQLKEPGGWCRHTHANTHTDTRRHKDTRTQNHDTRGTARPHRTYRATNRSVRRMQAPPTTCEHQQKVVQPKSTEGSARSTQQQKQIWRVCVQRFVWALTFGRPCWHRLPKTCCREF